jgi:hypothetical protein
MLGMDMPKRSRRPADLNRLAASIVRDATNPKPQPTMDEVRALARLLGSRGGKKGGKARAAKLSASERSESARKAARARWRSRTK